MKISTIILNWNRDILLDRTLASYADTVREPFELVVVDNNSTDRSRQVIEKWETRIPKLRSILLDANIGGEAINLAFPELTGELIHISENDQLYLPGWCEHAREAFALFPDLGQLSLWGAAPTDEGNWYDNAVPIRRAKAKILYEVWGNVTTSCILRRFLVIDFGIRIRNLLSATSDSHQLPDDGKLSQDVKEAGYWCAWSDRYYVRNLGHELSEFKRDPEYYRNNYASKPWLGVAGWRDRVQKAEARPKFSRHSLIFPSRSLQPELRSGPDGRPGQLWSMLDGNTAELEVLEFLYALVRLCKPANVLETGTWLGGSAIAIASALRDNGFGRLLTVEIDPEISSLAQQNIRQAGLDDWVTLTVGNSRELAFAETYQLAFFDTHPPSWRVPSSK